MKKNIPIGLLMFIIGLGVGIGAIESMNNITNKITTRGYVVANYTINDPGAYQKYVEAVMSAIAEYGGKLIIGDFEPKKLEGNPGQGIVVVEFASFEAANRFYNSPEYTKNKHFRLSSTEGWVVIAKEFVMPKQ